jgi:hypothetical protein
MAQTLCKQMACSDHLLAHLLLLSLEVPGETLPILEVPGDNKIYIN